MVEEVGASVKGVAEGDEVIGYTDNRASQAEYVLVAKVSAGAELEQVANTYESKYDTHLTAPDGTRFGLGDTIRRGEVLVCRVTPTTMPGFARDKQFSQTRWHFV